VAQESGIGAGFQTDLLQQQIQLAKGFIQELGAPTALNAA
jgi:hypothetical protein